MEGHCACLRDIAQNITKISPFLAPSFLRFSLRVGASPPDRRRAAHYRTVERTTRIGYADLTRKSKQSLESPTGTAEQL